MMFMLIRIRIRKKMTFAKRIPEKRVEPKESCSRNNDLIQRKGLLKEVHCDFLRNKNENCNEFLDETSFSSFFLFNQKKVSAVNGKFPFTFLLAQTSDFQQVKLVLLHRNISPKSEGKCGGDKKRRRRPREFWPGREGRRNGVCRREMDNFRTLNASPTEKARVK